MQGLHLTAALHHRQCDTAWLTDAARLLAESHLCVHTWPEQRGEVAAASGTPKVVSA